MRAPEQRLLIVFAALALGSFAGALPPAAGAYVWCHSPQGPSSLFPGQSITAQLRCEAEPPAAITITPPPPSGGLTITVAAGADPASFVLTASAAADAAATSRPALLSASDGGPEPRTIDWWLTIKRAPVPECRMPPVTELRHGIPSVTVEVYCPYDEEVARPVLELVAAPAHGRVSADSLDWIYQPRPGFVGTDRFRFRAVNAFGSSPVLEARIRVRRATVHERSMDYHARVCRRPPPATSCRAGRGRRAPGGGDKVSHRNWPRITGVYFTFPGPGSGTLRGAELNDEVLGHHGSDRLFGGAGSDVLWGDWDPKNNNGRQRDLLDGGAGSDFIYTSHGHNTVRAGTGNDFVWAFYGRGTVDCGSGVDKVRVRGSKRNYRLKSCELRGRF